MPTPAGSPSNPVRIDLGNHVGVELGRSATAQTSLGETATRLMAGKSSGTIKLSDLWSKSRSARYMPPSDLFDVIFTPSYIYGPALFGYTAGRASVEIFIAAGSGIFSTSSATPALTIRGWASGDRVKIINYGTIRGRGGNGGRGDSPGSSGAQAGSAGGTALKLEHPTDIENYSDISGGGGGGGGGGGWVRFNFWGFLNQNDGSYGGGGGGGGAGSYTSYFGAGGAGGIAYAQELRTPGNAGASGTATAGGAGGSAPGGGTGGAGGGLGVAGGNGGGGNSTGGASGGSAGYSIDGTRYATYISQGTLNGPTLY